MRFCLQIINFSRKFTVYAHYLLLYDRKQRRAECCHPLTYGKPLAARWALSVCFSLSVQRIWLTVAAKYCAASQPDNKQQNKFMFSAGCFHGLVSRFGKTEKAGHTWLFTTKSSGSNLKPRVRANAFSIFLATALQCPIMDLHFESGPGSLADDDNGGSEIICMLGCLLLIFCTIFSQAAIITHTKRGARRRHIRVEAKR